MTQQEVNDYLARIRKTLADSQAAIDAAALRLQETDRLLEKQGLTREQVLNFRFTREQRLLVNEELTRMGLPPVEEEPETGDFGMATETLRRNAVESPRTPDEELSARQLRFGDMMRAFRI